MAEIYTDQLRNHIVEYGFDAIKKSAREYIRSDNSKYHTMPTAGQLIEVIEQNNGSLKHELAKRKHDEEVKRIISEERKEMLKNISPEKMKELEARYERKR